MKPVRHVLCPIDFSECSTAALEHAAGLARWYGATVHGLYVYQPLPTLWHLPPRLETLAERPLARLRGELDRVLALARGRGIATESHVADGKPAPHILEHAARHHADLIVMGTHGRSGLRRLVLGSVAEAVVRQAPCPVLTLRPSAHPAADGAPFQRILCPVDFSTASNAAVAHAVALAPLMDAQVTLLHVVEPYYPGLLPTRARWTPETYADALTQYAGARLQELPVPPDVQAAGLCRTVLASGEVTQEILRAALDIEADLIVMGVHGGSGIETALFGSHANQVIRQAGCPVMTFTPAAAAFERHAVPELTAKA